jgi:hypothetical protein
MSLRHGDSFLLPSAPHGKHSAVPAFRLSCLTYLIFALPSATLGLLWPWVRLAFHEPVGALGIVLIAGTVASVAASAATGRLL